MISSRSLARFLRFDNQSSFSVSQRQLSAWVNAARADVDVSRAKVDVERQFTDENVQKLLADLTGMNLENKVFRQRRTGTQQRSHYALMTNERFEKTMGRMEDEARRFLQPIPFKEPRTEEFQVLSKDEEIVGFDQSRFIFTNITFDATDQDRAVVVREVDGTLRTATPEEHDRMNRVYYERPNRPVNEPALFTDPWLKNALERKEHEFVMDWACWFYEPDDPAFVKLSRAVFDRTVDGGDFEALYSTRHFGTLAFYLALNGNIPPLLNWFGGLGRLSEAARLVRLQKTLHPNWRVAVSSEDNDRKIVEDFLRQNERLKTQLTDLIRFLKTGRLQSEKREDGVEGGEGEGKERRRRDFRKQYAAVNSSTVGTTAGPLGSMSTEYQVNMQPAEGQAKPTDNKERRHDNKYRRQPYKKEGGGGTRTKFTKKDKKDK